MIRAISQRELRNDSAAVLRAVEGGERLVITRNGTPVGELVPLSKPRFVSREAIVRAAQGAPAIDFAAFRSDLDDLVDPWLHD